MHYSTLPHKNKGAVFTVKTAISKNNLGEIIAFFPYSPYNIVKQALEVFYVPA